MSRLLNEWRELVREYADEFALTRRDLVRDWLFGTATIAVVLLDLVAIAAVTGGAK